MHGKRQKSVSTRKRIFDTFDGGDKRDRTADLLNAIQALSQLSYTPGCNNVHAFTKNSDMHTVTVDQRH